MKKNFLLIFFFLFSWNLVGANLAKKIFSQEQKLIITATEEKKEELKELKEKKEELEKELQVGQDAISKQIAQVTSDLNAIKYESIRKPNDNFLKRKTDLFSQEYNVLKDTQKLWDRLITPIEENITLHEQYLSDPDFEGYSELVGDKTIYSFEDLQKTFQLVEDQKKKVQSLKNEKENEEKELENRKKAAKANLAEFESLKEKRQQDQLENYQGLSDVEQEQILDLEEQLFLVKSKFNDKLLQEIEFKIDLTDMRLFLERQKLDLARESLKRIKPKVRISEATITVARDRLSKKKQESFYKTAELHQEIDVINRKIGEKEEEQKRLSTKYSITVNPEINVWETEPVKTPDGYTGLCLVGKVHDQLLLAKRYKDYLQARLELEEKNFGHNGLEEVFLDVKETFYKIITRKFATEQELNQEKKKYQETYRSRVNADISDITNRKNKAEDYLEAQKKALEHIDGLKKQVQEQKNTVFAVQANAYEACIGNLNNAKKLISDQIKYLKETISTYNDVLATLKKILKQIDFISAELDSIGIWWQRPEYAITWASIKKTVPDATEFFRDLKVYLLNFSVKNFVARVVDVLRFPLTALAFVLKLFSLLLILFLFWFYLPSLVHLLLKPAESKTLIHILRLFAGFVCQFIYYYFGFLATWFFLYTLLNLLSLADPYPFILFYLISIPFFLFLANRFIAYLAQANRKNNYLFIGKEFENRFIFVFSLLTYATISIFFFRKAFLLSGYTQSEVPTILLALNLIILQISLISFLVKEPILSIVPEDTPFWQWIKALVSKYYYLILAIIIAIIIMSNPYVGFGRLVLYILTRVFYSIVLVVGLIWLHNWLKKAFLHLFFATDVDLVKERFNYAKTWYGITVIFLFLASFIFGVFFIAKIWGWPPALTDITDWSDIINWLKTPFIGQETKQAISLYVVLQGIFFIVVGILLASAFDRFVLGKISDVLVVDPGVQDTISRFSRYLIIAIAIIVGLATANLSSLLPYIGGALLALGFVIKEPLADFFAHFIILVQRPIKIGDYIEIDENVAGVVRKVTARSVIIRKKNSSTIIVPNSEIINKAVFNWNYTRGFVALNDINISVSYESDPNQVVKLLLEVFQENQNILKNPKPIIRLNDFSLDGFQFMMRGFVSSNYTLDIWDIASDIRIGVSKKLKENNIKLAIPVRLLMRTKGTHEHMGTDQGTTKE